MPAVSGEVYITSPDKGISLNNQQQNKINHLLTCHIYKMRNMDLFFWPQYQSPRDWMLLETMNRN